MLQESRTQLSECVNEHQRHLESMDANRESANLIITALLEGELRISEKLCRTNDEKIARIFHEIYVPDVPTEGCWRLG